jgi:hypothetical protein
MRGGGGIAGAADEVWGAPEWAVETLQSTARRKEFAHV